jgi:hypothetical protein
MATDKIEDCVSSLRTIASGEKTLSQKVGDAESRICQLLLDSDPKVCEWSDVLRLLAMRLVSEVNVHSGSMREFFDKVIDWLMANLRTHKSIQMTQYAIKQRA